MPQELPAVFLLSCQNKLCQFGHGKNNLFAFSPIYYSVMIFVMKVAEGLPVTVCFNVHGLRGENRGVIPLL